MTKRNEYWEGKWAPGRDERIAAARRLLCDFLKANGVKQPDTDAVDSCARELEQVFTSYIEVLVDVDCERSGSVFDAHGRPIAAAESELRQCLNELATEYKRRVGRAQSAENRATADKWYREARFPYELEARGFGLRLDKRINPGDKDFVGVEPCRIPGVKRDWYRRDKRARAEVFERTLEAGQALCQEHGCKAPKSSESAGRGLYTDLLVGVWTSVYRPLATELLPRLFEREGAKARDRLDFENSTTTAKDFVKLVDREVRAYRAWNRAVEAWLAEVAPLSITLSRDGQPVGSLVCERLPHGVVRVIGHDYRFFDVGVAAELDRLFKPKTEMALDEAFRRLDACRAAFPSFDYCRPAPA